DAGFGRLCVVDTSTGAVRELSRGVHGGLSWVGDRIACVVSGARTPAQVVTIDPTDGTSTLLARGPVAGFEAAGLVQPEAVQWTADDGADVYGRLYRPAAPAAGLERAPLLVWVHGGPTGQWAAAVVPRIAFF